MTTLASYTYLGLGDVVRLDYPEPSFRYTLLHVMRWLKSTRLK